VKYPRMREKNIFFIRGEVILKREASDNFDSNIRKRHDCETYNCISKSCPCFLEILFFSLCCKKHISNIEKYRNTHNSEKSYHINLDIFEKIIFKCNIRITIGTIITTIHLKE